MEVLGAPRSGGEGSGDPNAVGDTLLVEGLDAVHAGGGIEVLAPAPEVSLRRILRGLFQVKLKAIALTYGIEALPGWPKGEAQLRVVGDRTL